MATLGERIKRARIARKLSGEELAIKVGYAQQSAISNLENRGGGSGGKKLPEIARALRVPIAWLMEGPDEEEIPFTEPLEFELQTPISNVAKQPDAGAYSADASLSEAVEIFKKLRTEQRLKSIQYMRDLLSGVNPGTKQADMGESDPVPHVKAA